jgi:hypothetical protein
MDEVLLFALPLAAVAAVAALVRPARQRVVPVARAVGRAGAAVGGTAVAGGRGVVDAAMHGESRPEGQGGEGAGESQPESPAARTRRRASTATSR